MAFLRSRRALCASMLLAASAALSHAAVHAEDTVVQGALRVDGLAAVVGALAPVDGSINILRSDVELRARVALSGAGASDAAMAPLPASLLRATLDELLGEALIAAEARRVGLETPGRGELADERARFVKRAGGDAAFAALRNALGVTAREIDAVIMRRAVVTAFLRANLEGTLEVTPGELKEAYDKGDHPFVGQPFADVADGLRAFLTQRRLEASVARWVESLRTRTPHRVLVTY